MTKKAKDQVSLCRQTGGTELNLSDCEIRKLGSFKSIVRLKLLVRLNLSHNYLQGMPPTVKKLVNLEELDISYNEIHVLPWELYQLTNLRVLITEGNGITSLPTPAISRLVNLETLSVASNRLTGLPEDFTGLRSLTSLSLAKNSLVKVFPEVFQLKQLKHLNLSINPGLEVPERFGELPNLQVLELTECGITSLTSAIGNVTSLTHLRLDKNELTSLPDELANLSKLQILNVSFNQLTVIDNVTFRNFAALEEIHGSNNRLDHLPRGLGQCKKLRVIDLSHNQLKSINREVGWLHATIRKLHLGDNKIKTVPGELSFLNPAVDLDLGNNPLGSPFVQWYTQGIITLMENLAPYLRAYPAHCVAEGDALAGTTAGTPTMFSIRAADYHGNTRLNGGDEFEAVFRGVDKDNNPIEQKAVIKDNQDGTYTVFFNATVAGNFELHITESGESIGNSPLPYVIEPGRVDVNETIITGVPPSSVPVGNPIQLSITARDRFRNATTPDQPFLVTVATPGGQVAKLSCQATSLNVFMCAFTPASAGDHQVSIQYQGVHLPDSPFLVYVV